jgi:anthranilate synthase component 1
MTAFADTRRGDNKMKQMTLEEISKAAASGAFRKIPVSREIYSDIRTPVETLKVLQGVSSHWRIKNSGEDTLFSATIRRWNSPVSTET